MRPNFMFLTDVKIQLRDDINKTAKLTILDNKLPSRTGNLLFWYLCVYIYVKQFCYFKHGMRIRMVICSL